MEAVREIEAVVCIRGESGRRDVPLYVEELADIVERVLKDRWKGAWPINRRQVVSVGREFGVFVDIATENAFGGMLVDNVVDVRDTGNERVTLRNAIHELAELAATRTIVPEYVGPPDALLAHRVAQVVDQRFDAFYRFVQLGKINELEQRKRRRRKPDLETMELTYERDENCDPEFGE